MQHLSRRSILASGTAAAASTLFAESTFNKPLDVQLYTVRNEMPKQPKETLEAIAKIGYTQVEPGRADLAKIEPYLKEFKLATPSVHIDTPLVTGNWTAWKALQSIMPKDYTLAQAMEELKKHDAKFAVVSYLMPGERGGLDFYKKFAEQMNKAGEESKKHDIQLCYHHHSFEFEPKDGTRPFDVLVKEFDPKLVHFQCDIFWLSIGGNNVVDMLNQLKGRVASVHLKDIEKGTPTNYKEGSVPKGAFKEAGNGSLDFSEILKTCEKTGVKVYVVEQDQCAGSPLNSLAQSYKYLRTVKV
jgi:sugar phosphate isomerase/epimerase